MIEAILDYADIFSTGGEGNDAEDITIRVLVDKGIYPSELVDFFTKQKILHALLARDSDGDPYYSEEQLDKMFLLV